MRRLSSIAWRSLGARRARTTLTVAGIALGVGILFAAMATNSGIDDSIDRTVRQMVGRADLRIGAFGELGLSDRTLGAVQGTPGVALAVAELEQRTYLERPPGAAGGYDDPVTVLGIEPADDPQLHDLPLASGNPLARADEPSALITERLSRATGITLGGQLTLLGTAAAGPQPFRVVGILAGDGPLVGALGRTVVVPIERAEQVFGRARVSRIDVLLAPDASRDAVIGELERRITTEPFVVAGPVDLADSLRASTADFRAMTALMAAVALFVGAFLIFNTLSMTVAERVREVGLLRAAGTTARQVNGLILLQALALGVAGSVAGIALGIVLGWAMAAYVRSTDAVPIDSLDVPWSGVLLALALGIAVTLAAAMEPAWRAGRISPVEALKARVDPSAGMRARLRWLVVVFAVVALSGLALWPRGAGLDELARSLVVFAILLGGTLLTPLVLGPLGRLAGLPFALFLPTEERLTRGALVRDRSRTALTVGALTVALAMIVAVASLAQNARQSASDWLAGVVPGDEVATSIRPAALAEGLQSVLAGVDGVARVTPIATFEV
ncbi:MAG TPA: FtsX-like permease family protein, partial [Candidatus Limnocylindrales bacterium]